MNQDENEALFTIGHESSQQYETIAVLPLLTALEQLGYPLGPGIEIAIAFGGTDRAIITLRREATTYTSDLSYSPRKSYSALKKEHPGFIYLVKGEGNLYKVGRTKNPGQRFATFETTLPFSVKLVSSYQVPDMKPAELHWHSLFADKHINGEWFRLDEGDVQAFIATAQETP